MSLQRCCLAPFLALGGRSHPGLRALSTSGAGLGCLLAALAIAAFLRHLLVALLLALFVGHLLLGALLLLGLSLLLLGAAVLAQHGHTHQSDAEQSG